jgi:acyl-CoA synthetase (AMP-forming)/AMP-acid ligase II
MEGTAHPLTTPGVVERAARVFGDREALVDGDLRIGFAELAHRIERTARAMIASGVEPGDRVAVWAPNMAEWVFAAMGAHRAAGVVVPLNTRFRGHEAEYILRRSGARLLFTVTDFLDTDYVAMLRDVEVPAGLEEIVVLGGPRRDGTTTWAAFDARADAVAESESSARAAAITPDDLSDILFTSGTTGAPKGAMLRHGPSVRAYTDWCDVVGLAERDRYLVVNPFFHTFGLKAGILASLVKGATIIPHPVFDVASVMERVAAERVTMLPGPPALYQTILDHPDLGSYDLSSLRLAVTGAATVPVEMIRRMRSELTFRNIVTGYGLTETTGIATMCRHTDDPETIASTCGRPIPDVEVRVVADDGSPCATGEPGEVVVRGYNVMAGYFGDPEETAVTIDSDGWLHTGDVGVADEAGNLRITDRIKDMFIVGGFNAYPAEIEQIMMRHPAVGQVAVVGVPDQRLGEVGKAFVVPRVDRTVEVDALIGWCRVNMANFKVPRSVVVVDALPLNASGKVQKFKLRERAD